MKALIFLLLMCTSVETACAFGRHPKHLVPDTVPDALNSNDATGLVEGCGQQPIVGFTYCRHVEGDVADEQITFIGPPAQCNEANCVFVKVYDNKGQLAWGDALPKGHTRISVPWKTLLGAPSFQVENRGFWSFNTEVFWVDTDGHERRSVSQGDIILRVYRTGYTPLDHVANDPNFVWSWQDGNRIYKMTAGLRAYVSEAHQ